MAIYRWLSVPARSLALTLATCLINAVLPSGVVASDLAHPYAERRVIVGFEPDATPAQRRRALSRSGVARAAAAAPVAKDVVRVPLVRDESVPRAADAIATQPGVAYAEPDYLVRPAALADDPWYTRGDLWGMYGDDTAPHVEPYGSGAGEAWARGQVGDSVVHVGIVDEGVAVAHPDLAANIWRNPHELVNGIDDDGNGYVDDVSGWDFYHDDATVYDSDADDHGTHVAGTVGARGGNGTGVAGVSWQATLIVAKFMGPGGGYVSDAVRALDYLADLRTRHDLAIVASNNSWEGGGHSQALHDAISRGGDVGILFVSAAGNSGRDSDAAPTYPGAYTCDTRADGSARGWDCVVSVAALERDGSRRADSAWGARSVDLAAPGGGITSTWPTDTYVSRSGTSMAAAHVSGALALCASQDTGMAPHRLRSLLLETAAATDSMADGTVSGARLDAGALAAACAPADPPSAVALEVDDLDPAFRRYGADWFEGWSGHDDHHFWLPAQERRTRYASWRPQLAEAGWYDVRAYVPEQHATSRRATYRIRTETGWVTRIRNHKKRQGSWVSLGTHRLTATPIVQLSDKTGESTSLGRRLAFDALRFVRVAGPPPD